jgi:hypothetical protein
MERKFVAGSAGALVLTFLHGLAWAQSGSGSIVGSVRDTSGALLPGVTVEAASPALIEKVRTVVTDNVGQYKILNLQPGVFVVTFTLSGFKTVRREGVQLSAGDTVNVTAEMTVGAVEETVTVSGATPLVDIQGVTTHSVITQDVMETLPAGRGAMDFAALIPGMTFFSTASPSGQLPTHDVGGNQGEQHLAVTFNGSRETDTPLLLDGMVYANLRGSGATSSASWSTDSSIIQEVVVDTAGHSAETPGGGAKVNAILKEGGNTFRGSFIGDYTHSSLQANNISPDLTARGVAPISLTNKMFDVSPMLGGPIKRDKLWFFAALRYEDVDIVAPGTYYATDPLSPVYTPDLSRPASNNTTYNWQDVRLTWQATPRNKFGLYLDHQTIIIPFAFMTSTTPPNGAPRLTFPNGPMVQVTYNSPVTNKLLVELGVTSLPTAFRLDASAAAASVLPTTELSTGVKYGSYNIPVGADSPQANMRAKVSYVTGSQAFEFGMQLLKGSYNSFQNGSDITRQLLNGVPKQVTVYTSPWTQQSDLNYDGGLFVQDKWTVNRLTLNLGGRFDFVKASVPAQSLPAVEFVGARNFAAIDNLPNWKDFTERLGVAYDVFGNGKTAVKASLGKYVQAVATGLAGAVNPVATTVNSTTRPWNDLNGDLIPQANELGPLANPNFGQLHVVTTYDPNYLNGWNKREYNWEGDVSVQHEVRPGVSVTAGFSHRSYGNLIVNKNLDVSSTDYSPFCVTAPMDSRLPGGGGNQICGFYDINPNKFGQVNNLVTFASIYGNVIDKYDGFDLTVNARLAHGIIVQGGTNNGRELTDYCDVSGKVDNGLYPVPVNIGTTGNPSNVPSPSTLYCRVSPPFATNLKLLAVFPLPWWGITASTTFQSVPGPPITAAYTVTNAQIQQSLGRPLSGGATVTTVQLMAPDAMLGDRWNQLDVRAAKTFKVDRLRLRAIVDVYNVLNANAVSLQNNTYGPAWQNVQAMMPGRFFKFGAQIDF